MPDRTQDLTNHRKVAVACKKYTDEQIAKSEERIKWYVGEYQTTTQDDNTTAYQKTVPSGATRVKIKKIYGNSVKYAPTTASDTTIAYQKNVPSYSPSIDRASASMNILGGMSYKSVNLFSLDNTSITIPAGSEQWYFISNETLKSMGLINGNTYTVKGNNAPSGLVYQKLPNYNGFDTNAVSFTMDDNIVLRIGNNTVSQDVTFNLQIMLNEGSSALPYEPYYSNIRDTAPTSVKSVGSNLVQNNTATTQYVDTDQFLAELLPSTTYTISFVSSASGEFTLRSVYSAIDLLFAQSVSIGLNSYTFTTPSNYTNTGNYLYFYATSDVVGTELRINKGSTALPYKPYFTASLLIPAQVQALDGYGWGIDDTCYNYIDFNAKIFKQIGGRVNLGTLNYTTFDVNGHTCFYCDIITMKASAKALCSQFEYKGDNRGLIDGDKQFACFNPTDKQFIFRDDSKASMTPEQFKTAMSGVYLYYELATSVETDISAYLTTNEIEIEPNGTLSFESTYNAYVPSDVSYNGVIKHALVTAIKHESFNIWDEEWEDGSINTTTGQNESQSDRIRSKNYIEVNPNVTYYFRDNSGGAPILQYDSNQNYIGYAVYHNQTFTLNANCKYIRFYCASTTYQNDICINISGTLNGTYKPHKATVTCALPYQASDGWGIGSVRNVRDFTTNKRGTNIGNKDLGDLNYDNYYQGLYLSSGISDMVVGSQYGTPNILCEKYTTDTDGHVYNRTTDKTITVQYTQQRLFIYDTTYTNIPLALKPSLVGVPLFYELDDEHKTESDITAIDNILVVEEGDTLTFVNEEGLPVPSDLTYRIEVAR